MSMQNLEHPNGATLAMSPATDTVVEVPFDQSPKVIVQPQKQNSSNAQSMPSGLMLLAVIAVLYLARELFMPTVAAIILALVFMPWVRLMQRHRIPAAIAAGLIVLSLLTLFVTAAYHLAEPARIWLEKAPQSLSEIDHKLRGVVGPIHKVTVTAQKMQDITNGIANGGVKLRPAQTVVMQSQSMVLTVVNATRGVVFSAISVLILLYFLLACGDMFLRKTVIATHRLSDKKRAVDIALQVEAAVSRYLLTVVCINFGLGCVVALTMYFIGMPNPVLWGVMVALFNFVPYFGDLASLTILSVVGLLTFDQLWMCALPPLAFYTITALEGYLITPFIIGKRLSLNPVVVVFGILFWGWMWGVAGALLAVPIIVVMKTMFARVESLHVYSEFMGN